jgi:hypothetical protein
MRALFSLHVVWLAAILLSAQQPATRPVSATEAMYEAQASSCERKFEHIRQNADQPHPDQTPTVITQDEINAWFSSGKAQFPKGVKKLRFSGEPGIVHATALVDFDEITAGARSSNPLLALFTGIHEVQATAHASGSGGIGHVHVDSVSLDGFGVPRMALEFFIDRYIKPKHPEIGLDSRFKLPYRIDIARIGSRELTITQK